MVNEPKLNFSIMKSKITPIVSSLCILIFFLGATVLAQSPLRVAPKMEQVKELPAQVKKETPATKDVAKATILKTTATATEMQIAPIADLTDSKQAANEKKRLQMQLKKLEAQETQSIEAKKERDRITALVKKRLERLNSKKQVKSTVKGDYKKSSVERTTSNKKNAEKQGKKGQ